MILASGRALARPLPADVAGALGATTTRRSACSMSWSWVPVRPVSRPRYTPRPKDSSVLVVEPLSLGGQASSSPMLRNYLGFPAGVERRRPRRPRLPAGMDVWSRLPDRAHGRGDPRRRGRADRRRSTMGRRSRAGRWSSRPACRIAGWGSRAVERPRRAAVSSMDPGATEARAMAGEPVFVVGGANSAGEAAIHLARHAERVTVLVRGSSIAEMMSDYLVRELEAIGRISTSDQAPRVAEALGDRRLRGLLSGTTPPAPPKRSRRPLSSS